MPQHFFFSIPSPLESYISNFLFTRLLNQMMKIIAIFIAQNTSSLCYQLRPGTAIDYAIWHRRVSTIVNLKGLVRHQPLNVGQHLVC